MTGPTSGDPIAEAADALRDRLGIFQEESDRGAFTGSIAWVLSAEAIVALIEPFIRRKAADEIRSYAEANYPPACSATITADFLAARVAGGSS